MNNIRTPLSNIMRIMNLVLKRIEKKGLPNSKRALLVRNLLKRGYKIEDIDTAMKLVSVMTSQIDPILHLGERDTNNGTTTGVRQLHQLEAIRMTANAQKLLLSLIENKVITPLHFERVIDYIWRYDMRHVGVARLELLILLNKPESEQLENIDEPLPQSFALN